MENLINDFVTTLNGGINDVVTTIVVTTNTSPANQAGFRIRIDNELMLVTANPTTSWTVTRGIEGTTAAAHSNGAFVSVVITAAGLAAWLSDNAPAEAANANSVDIQVLFNNDGVVTGDAGFRYDVGRLMLGSVTDDTVNRLQVDGTSLFRRTTMYPAAAQAADAIIVALDDASASMQIVTAGNGGISTGYRTAGAAGTPDTPLATNTTDNTYIGYLGAGGYDGTTWQTSSAGLVGVKPGGTWSGTSRPAFLTFETTNVNATGRSERLRITPAGRLVQNAITDDGAASAQFSGTVRTAGAFQAQGSVLNVGGTVTFMDLAGGLNRVGGYNWDLSQWKDLWLNPGGANVYVGSGATGNLSVALGVEVAAPVTLNTGGKVGIFDLVSGTTARVQGYDWAGSSGIPLALNSAGGNVLVGSTTDDGFNKLQVTGAGNFTGQLTATDDIFSNSGDVYAASAGVHAKGGAGSPQGGQSTFMDVSSGNSRIGAYNWTTSAWKPLFVGDDNISARLIVGTATDDTLHRLQVNGTVIGYSDTAYNSQGGSLRGGNKTTPGKVVQIGFDGTADVGYVRSLHDATAQKPLAVQPQASTSAPVLIGTVAASGTYVFEVNGASQVTGTLNIEGQIQSGGASAGVVIDRRDTGASAWTIYSQAGTFSLYDNSAGADRLYLSTAGALWTRGSASGYYITKRDDNADSWALYSQSGELNFYDFTASGNRVIFRTGGHIEMGGGSSAPELRLIEPSGGGTSYTGFKAPALAGNVVYTLPIADGPSGSRLETDGAAALGWKLDARKYVTSDSVHATAATFADVTGLTQALLSGKRYTFEAVLFHQNNATSTGSQFGYNIGAAPTAAFFSVVTPVDSAVGSTSTKFAAGTTSARDTAAVATDTGTTGIATTVIKGYIQPSADGTFAIRATSEVTVAAGLTIKAGSYLHIREI